ncbi:MAG: allophanate hydrolase [Alphaproteobacteria bacterium]|nr:allophanate hydrolase [Alphaproteobacteria bacterium]
MRPVAAAEAALAADRMQGDRAIWIFRVADDEVLARARELEREGPCGRPLWGVPFAVKDNIDIAGLPTTAACPGFSHRPDAPASCVHHLLDAGAVLIGKTNLDQFATGLVGIRSPYGAPRNRFDAERVPGGSSSGSAWAVSAGIVPFALGTDTAGSGRVPAAFANVVGLKPTRGSVGATGIVPACRSLDTVSVFARTVDEALSVQRVIAGHDPNDPYSRLAPFAHLRRGAMVPASRVAAGDVAALCDASTAVLYDRARRLLGAETVDVSPFLDFAPLLYEGPWLAERTAGLRDIVQGRPDILHPLTRVLLEAGFERRAVDAFDAFDRVAGLRRMLERLFCRYDALLLPIAPRCPTLAELAADPIGPNAELGLFGHFVNPCDLAGFAVPAGIGENGLPVGVMVLGPAWSEGRLAALADAVHRAFSDRVGATGQALPDPAQADPLAADETPLFCIGAHMTGLPLSGQLTGRGGRFLRTAQTAPSYRLYALGPRPGMVRAEPGAAISGEVWAVPNAALGALLAEVAPPLGFGTVQLQGAPCLGFLAEAAGLAGAPDITRFGGWRAWLEATRSPLQ